LGFMIDIGQHYVYITKHYFYFFYYTTFVIYASDLFNFHFAKP
jgi:hypothetical protein